MQNHGLFSVAMEGNPRDNTAMQKLLNQIHSPADLRALNKQETESLCQEIRECIVSTVMQNGGHMASNLGVVELTIALHKAFDAPSDQIVFDVGHQCYTHKLLTGRADRFCTLRTRDGISGFPNCTESPYDAFQTGHSSTSISAAVGMARARDLAGQTHSVVAVIGDGALTGGMSYEALNDGADLGSSLIVILNDNEMSISKNVGGMTEYLNKIRSSPRYHSFKRRFKGFLRSIPLIGGGLYRVVDWTKDCVKRIFLQPVFFEEIGYVYLGPIDGHDVDAMVSVFSQAKELDRPVFIHVITQKGRGYRPAAKDPEKFHGVSPFVVEKNGNGGETCSHLLGRKLIELSEKDRRITAVTAAMPTGTGLSAYQERFPKRCFDVGIAEEHGVTMSAGMAKAGMRPYFAVYASFLQRAYDQILTDVCIQGLPVTLCVDRAGIVGEDGETHHGVFDLSMMMPMPGLTIMEPATPSEMEEMLEMTLTLNGPCAIRYPKGSLWAGSSKKEPVVYGKAQELLPISRITVVTAGSMVGCAYEAISQLAQKEIEAIGLVNLRFLKPLDGKLLRRLEEEAQVLLVVEENSVHGGIGDALAGYFSARSSIRIEKLGVGDAFVKHGQRVQLLHELGLDRDGIASRLETILEESR